MCFFAKTPNLGKNKVPRNSFYLMNFNNRANLSHQYQFTDNISQHSGLLRVVEPDTRHSAKEKSHRLSKKLRYDVKKSAVEWKEALFAGKATFLWFRKKVFEKSVNLHPCHVFT